MVNSSTIFYQDKAFTNSFYHFLFCVDLFMFFYEVDKIMSKLIHNQNNLS